MAGGGRVGAMMPPDDLGEDVMVKAVERSTIAQTLRAARASMKEPSRPFTQENRSLFQMPDAGSSARPTSGYSVEQLSFVRDTYGGRSDSRGSHRSGRRPETIAEDEEGYRREGGADVLRLDDDEDSRPVSSMRPSPNDSEAASSGSEELTVVTASGGGSGGPMPPSGRMITRPPRPPGVGYPAPGASALRPAGGYPEQPPPVSVSDLSPRARRQLGQVDPNASVRKRASDGSPRRRKSSRSPAPPAAGVEAAADRPATGSDAVPGGHGPQWDAACEVVIEKLQSLAVSKDQRKKDAGALVELCERVCELVADLKAGKGTRPGHYAQQLLRECMGFMDLKDMKDARCLFKLARSALGLLAVEGATEEVHSSGVQAAYLNIAQVLFKYSQKGDHDAEFRTEGLLEPLLEVLRSDAPECCSNDLRVYIVGVLKNVSHLSENQKALAQQNVVDVLFKLMGAEQLTGSSKEAQLLIQITAALRNLASSHYKQILAEERLSALTRTMALFPGHVELLTNVARILSKLTLHNSACEAIAKGDAHMRQLVKTLSANAESAPLTLRLAFVLGNLTERSDRLRVVFAFDCEGTALAPELLGRYWRKERQLARIELEKGQGKSTSMQEVEEVLVKLVRLLANVAISKTAGSTLAASSAVVEPLLDMLGAKRIGDSEELVLNVVAAVTNLSYYDVPSNLLFQEDNKQLLCRLFRPLLLESYNDEALIETARALGNLSRHEGVGQCMAGLRLDEILVILLDHEERSLVYFVCGILVNLAGAHPECTARLVGVCPLIQKLGKLLVDVSAEDDVQMQGVAVKVLMNLAMDPGVAWPPADAEVVREALEQILAEGSKPPPVEDDASTADERQQLLDLSSRLLAKLPPPPRPPGAKTCPAVGAAAPEAGAEPWFYCQEPGCGRRFNTQEKLAAHQSRRHAAP